MNKEQTKYKRSPVVVIMGHIDHGKSTLLDYIRKTNIVTEEAGGITQKTSAYEVEHPNSSDPGSSTKITFLDTPGHEAFGKMRARGAKVADIAVLVVAADDGVKPQTLEALKCIREEKIPFIVAINKIDKPEANIERTRNNLAENEIYLEGFGGDVPSVAISAKTGQNMTELLDLIVLAAELESLEGDPLKPAEGVVIESNLDPKKGVAATLIIKNGTLENGLFVRAGNAIAPVKIMENFLGKKIDKATFSSPVKIIGWSEMPQVGSPFYTFKTKKAAMENISVSQKTEKNNYQITDEQTEKGKIIVPIMVKAGSTGGLEAMIHEIEKLNSEKIKFKISNAGVGIISESNVKTANINEHAIILGFNTKIDDSAKHVAERESIVIQISDVIYKITEWLKNELGNHLPNIEIENIVGKAQIIKIFSTQKEKQVIGGKIAEGSIHPGETFRIKRRENEIGNGKIKELQHKKANVKEVSQGDEFGALVESKIEIVGGDVLEVYKITRQPIKI